uniref:Tr-type G domain-containing protein n=1 Tax=Ditylenchus dipsaci TaxID=166011 RepID=A0A915DIX6_9BILA
MWTFNECVLDNGQGKTRLNFFRFRHEFLDQLQRAYFGRDGKYLKTTIYGVSGYNPNYCALVVNARTGATSMTREHLGLALALDIPVFIVLTKIDLVTKSQREKVLLNIERLIQTLGKISRQKSEL